MSEDVNEESMDDRWSREAGNSGERDEVFTLYLSTTSDSEVGPTHP